MMRLRSAAVCVTVLLCVLPLDAGETKDGSSRRRVYDACSRLLASLDAEQVQRLSRVDQLAKQLLRPDQYALFAEFVKAEGAGYHDLGILKPGMSDEEIVSLPVGVNFILAASVRVRSGREETLWESAHRYSHPVSRDPQPAGGGPDFAHITTRYSSSRLEEKAKLFRDAGSLNLDGYPDGLPIPEIAYIRQVRVRFTALSPAQQRFVRSVIEAGEDALPQPFDWTNATVEFARTLHFRGSGVEVEKPPLNAKANGFWDQVW